MAITFTHVFAFLVALNVAFGLTCYQCDSSESALCNYGITSFTYGTTDCKQDGVAGSLTNWIPKQCVKIVAKSKEGKEYVARGCQPSVGETACNALAKTLGFFGSVEGTIDDMSCYACEGDKCNSAARFGGYTFIGLLLAAIAFLF